MSSPVLRFPRRAADARRTTSPQSGTLSRERERIAEMHAIEAFDELIAAKGACRERPFLPSVEFKVRQLRHVSPERAAAIEALVDELIATFITGGAR